MLTFQRKPDDDGSAVYEFRPEGKGTPGTVKIDLQSGKTSVVEQSPDDSGMSKNQMMSHMRRMLKAEDLKQSGTLSWY